MAYFVTGATGFIGRFLIAELLENREGTIYYRDKTVAPS